MLGLYLAMNVSNAGGEDPRQAHTEGRLHRVPGQVEELRGNPCGYFWTLYLFFFQYMPLPHRTQKRTPGNPSKTLARLKKPLNSSRRSRLRNFVGEILTIGHILQELKGHAAAKAQGQNNKRTYAKVLLLLMSNWSCWFPFTRRLRGDRLKSLRTKPPEWRWIWHWYCFS